MSNEYFKKLGFTVTSGYGWREIKKDGKLVKEFHPGVDLVAPKPQDFIKAFVDGKVIFSGEAKQGSGYGGFGNAVAVEDKYGCVHVYGHLKECIAVKGKVLKKGEILGVEGNEGISVGVAHGKYLPGEHLHYEIRKEKEYVSDREKRCYVPEEYLKQYFEKEKPVVQPISNVKTYKIKAGDTLSEIAEIHKITVKQLMKLNPEIKDASKVRAGQILKLG